ncbi:hypothetical protein [Burkholderia pseudomallei]|uniref:hypothetical protein n=1 Tax=Burkholderia pseudomallei TaxID=28450 RepID=UPI00050E9ED3|nr:hypothetical protein [Burkholderia pseudomallei]KGC58644.1 hypothetical protein DP56_1343 [Burkholderia pseudomallei]
MEPLNFAMATRAELVAWYEETVGYDPTKDDPALTTHDLRIRCEELRCEIEVANDPDLQQSQDVHRPTI